MASAAPDRPPSRALTTPTGAPVTLGCDQARQIVQQARAQLASPPGSPDLKPFADALVDWLDPHGLWSAAPDSPMGTSLRNHAREILTELEADPGSMPCAVTHEVGTELGVWVKELRGLYLAAEHTAPKVPVEQAFKFATMPAFEDGQITRPARQLAIELGYRVGAVHRSLGEIMDPTIKAALDRALPGDELDWSTVILAAAVRAYVPQIDPHGGWAPLDEETSLYEIDLEASPPPRLWRKMVRTAVGVRVEETSAQGIHSGDVVLSVGDIPTTCLSVEQAEQLAYVDVEGTAPLARRVLLMGPSDPEPRWVEARLSIDPSNSEERAPGLEVHRIPYGDGDVLVIPIGDVPDNLGDELSATLQRERNASLQGVVLDLRGNGGGSTDGASSALGLFLPGATLFPLRRRDGSIEVERAPAPPPAERWDGPVAALVDGDTASAAEMIAGALMAYRRGPLIGDRTYGKGCAQEYLDDEPRVGVLRLTTLLYALPDGSPVQMIGLLPGLRLPMTRAPEREANLAHSLRPWRGPDVRESSLIHEVSWPRHAGTVGPCTDPTVCRALRALGAPRASAARGRPRDN
jgi:carboxyl-terminal processing protease